MLPRVIALTWFGTLLTACSGLGDFRDGDLSVDPHVIECAAASDDPALDASLLEVLSRRAAGGLWGIGDAHTVQAIRALVLRRERGVMDPSVDPGGKDLLDLLDALVFDVSPEVRTHALRALDRMQAVGSLTTVAAAAASPAFEDTRELAYQTFSSLADETVLPYDEASLHRILASRGLTASDPARAR